MNIILFNDTSKENLYPLTFTKPTCEIRVGVLKIKEKWEKKFSAKASYLCDNYLQTKYPLKIKETNTIINGSIIPDNVLIKKIKNLNQNCLLIKGDTIIAGNLSKKELEMFNPDNIEKYDKTYFDYEFSKINYPWDIFRLAGKEIENDFKLLTKGKESQKLNKTNNFVQEERIFIEKGAKVNFTILNPDGGYIYVGENSEIMEGSIIRGSLALCENSVIKLGAKIYGPTTIGPFSKVGGEVNNSVIQGFSNKGHDGFLGNSVIGEWCNLGADTNNSNLKNNYAEVKLWNYKKKSFIKTGLQFCGLIMGDHSKCGINTMFNTGTVVGVSSNIFGSGFPRNFIPSFSWGGASGFKTYRKEKAFETAKLVMKRRDIEFDDVEKSILEYVYENTDKFK